MTPTEEFDGFLYRAIERRWLDSVLAKGITPDTLSYWGVGPVAGYYAETIEEEGEEPVIIRAPLTSFAIGGIEPDEPGIEEPLTHLLRAKEDVIYKRWCASDQSWKTSLDLVGSVRYRGSVPAAAIEWVC